MLKYQDFINEKESNLKLAWLKKSYEHAIRFRVPITPKIGKLLNDSVKITSFHITSIDNVLNIRSLISKKKSLSTFTEMEYNQLGDMGGIQTSGNILFQLHSDLLINANYDIMSRPDEQGRRWVAIHDLRHIDFFEFQWKQFKSEINDKFSPAWQSELLDACSKANVNVGNSNAKEWIKNNSKEINKYLNYYIKNAEEVVLNNKESFLSMFRYKGMLRPSWDEILVNNINVKDVLVYNNNSDINFNKIISSQYGSLEKFEQILKSFSSGEIYITNDSTDAIKFVKDRKE